MKHPPPQSCDPTIKLCKDVNSVTDQLCLAVRDKFNFTIDTTSSDESIQKLTMLLNFVLNIGRDAMASVEEQNEKLLELNKLKSDFMANISHELCTPLTLILGPLTSILSDIGDTPSSAELKNNLQRIHRNANRLHILVNDLLDFSKLKVGKYETHPELFDLKQLIIQIVEDTQGLANARNIALTLQCDDTLSALFLDQKMIEKVTLNLLSNAIKFTPANGKIAIHLTKQDNDIQLSIADTGIGISPTEIPKLFDRFYQADTSSTRKHEGAGVGLSISKQFTTLMGGDIHVESTLGQGSKFTVILPIHNAPDTQIPQETSSNYEGKLSSPSYLAFNEDCSSFAPNQDSERPLILLAEDNSDMRAYIISLLQDTYEVISVENGQQALEATYQYFPQVILSDVMMPLMDGIELTSRIKTDSKIQHIPIILITARSEKEAVASGLDIGADDYLVKPFSHEELRTRIQVALRMNQRNWEIMELNNHLMEEIEERKKIEDTIANLSSELIIASRRAGMADMAAGMMHNIGNVLNSVNTSINMIDQKVENCKMTNLAKIAVLLQKNKNDLTSFITCDDQGKHLPDYISILSEVWLEDKEYLQKEIEETYQGVQHIKEIIGKQNTFSTLLGTAEEASPEKIIDDALTLNRVCLKKESIEVIHKVNKVKRVMIDRVKVLQILVNLVKNSVESLRETDKKMKNITFSVKEKDKKNFVIQVIDNGIGIPSKNIEKMFTQGFTTKSHGLGIGLHASILSAQEMGGNLLVESEGLEKGAIFSLILPYSPPNEEDLDHDA